MIHHWALPIRYRAVNCSLKHTAPPSMSFRARQSRVEKSTHNRYVARYNRCQDPSTPLRLRSGSLRMTTFLFVVQTTICSAGTLPSAPNGVTIPTGLAHESSAGIARQTAIYGSKADSTNSGHGLRRWRWYLWKAGRRSLPAPPDSGHGGTLPPGQTARRSPP